MITNFDAKTKLKEPLSAKMLIIFGWLIIVAAFIGGNVVGERIKGLFSIIRELFPEAYNGAIGSAVSFAFVLLIWISGAISGTILIGMGKIIGLLTAIANKDYLCCEDNLEDKEFDRTGPLIQAHQEISKRISAVAEPNSLKGFSVLNGILYTYKNGETFESASVSIGGSIDTTEVIDGLLSSVQLVDVFGEVINRSRITFINIQANGRLFLTEAVPLDISEHDSQRIHEIRVKIINYSKNGKKVLSYNADN